MGNGDVSAKISELMFELFNKDHGFLVWVVPVSAQSEATKALATAEEVDRGTTWTEGDLGFQKDQQRSYQKPWSLLIILPFFN